MGKGTGSGAGLDPPVDVERAVLQSTSRLIIEYGWGKGRWLVLAGLIALPFALYHDDLASITPMWYAPIMGALAASLPASGAPIAGGIVFFPILTINNVCSRDAVAFSAATQLLGCGVYTPLNWLLQDPSVFKHVYDIFKVSFLPGLAGLAVSFVLAVQFSDDRPTEAIFIAFSCCVLAYTLNGLMQNRLVTSDAAKGGGACGPTEATDSAKKSDGDEESAAAALAPPAPLSEGSCLDFPARFTKLAPTWTLLIWFSACCFAGGILVGLIGIGIEKVIFMIGTWGAHGMHVRDASVSAITVVGVLSGISMVVHLLTPRCPLEHGYIGTLPMKIFLCAQPGVFLGSFVGPWVAKTVGSRNIMWAFCCFLLFDVVENLLKVTNALHTSCDAEGSCTDYIASHNVTALDEMYYDGCHNSMRIHAHVNAHETDAAGWAQVQMVASRWHVPLSMAATMLQPSQYL